MCRVIKQNGKISTACCTEYSVQNAILSGLRFAAGLCNTPELGVLVCSRIRVSGMGHGSGCSRSYSQLGCEDEDMLSTLQRS